VTIQAATGAHDDRIRILGRQCGRCVKAIVQCMPPSNGTGCHSASPAPDAG